MRPRWLSSSILGVAGLAAGSGFAQFGVAVALSDVASAFGEPQPDFDLAVEAGLTGTTLGIGLGIIRLASISALPLAGMADKVGRKRVLLATATIGLMISASAALSPGYWWFVAIFALGRPFLSATSALAFVVAAEETSSEHRSKAIAFIGASYAAGAGIPALLSGIGDEGLGFRWLFALSLIPLAAVPMIGRFIKEPKRFETVRAVATKPPTGLGWVHPSLRSRLALLGLLAAAVGVTSGLNVYFFYFAESVKGISSGVLALVVLAAAPIGLAGLLVGRWVADNIGRRVGCASTTASIACTIWLTYNGGRSGVIAGYLLGIFLAGAYGPAAGSLNAELFPTSERSTVAGWLTAAGVVGAVIGIFSFGTLADVFDGFGTAAIVVTAPVILLSALYIKLPETRGLELEESAPEPLPLL